jgi:quercetin dioxygenase-like cupin family protein
MRTRIALIAAVMLLMFGPDAGSTLAQTPPGPTKVYESKIAVANPPAQADLIQDVLDFAPGAWTPFHRHGGQAFNLVLEGEVTLRENNTEKVFKPGEGWSDTPDQVHAAGNNGTVTARLFVTFLLPREAPLTTVQQGGSTQQPPPGPTKVYESKIAIADVPQQADLIQTVLDFDPAIWTPPHSHGGTTLNTILEGEITLREDGVEKVFKPGEMWSDMPGRIHAAGNAGSVKARLAVTFLLPKGAAQTTVQAAAPAAAPAALPKTSEPDRWPWHLLVGTGLVLVLLGLLATALRREPRMHR